MKGKTHFAVHPEKLDEVAAYVTDVTLANYPDLKIPFHARWGHFQVGPSKAQKVDRLAQLEKAIAGIPDLTPAERARVKLDLVIVSVLLDAGSGPDWKYKEGSETYARSEGLAVASFHLFMSGAFSSNPAMRLRADANGLQELSLETLARGFQVSDSNPLAGLEGRLGLLKRLGQAIAADAKRFGGPKGASVARPGHIYDYCISLANEQKPGSGPSLPATVLLRAVLDGLGPIWPGRIRIGGADLGDAWRHPLLGRLDSDESIVPFHKLSQWMTYSLVEPIEEAGLKITGAEELTGLPEYRNGGLLLDRGLISLRDPKLAEQAHRADSELVVEWRALTIVLIEEIASRVRAKLGKSEAEFPLARVLEGGTWWAGRKAAAEKRPGGGPPLKIESDGTVF